MSAAVLPPVPDLDGRRFCHHFNTTLPLASFPSGRRRYICRKHVWQCVTKPSKSMCLKTWTRMLWKRCWTDARQTFKQTRVGIVQGDIDALLRDAGNENLDRVSILPVDPTRVLCKENASGIGCNNPGTCC